MVSQVHEEVFFFGVKVNDILGCSDMYTYYCLIVFCFGWDSMGVGRDLSSYLNVSATLCEW